MWNTSYGDAAVAVNLLGSLEVIFANDLKCFQDCRLCIANVDTAQDMRRCQQKLHKYGYANQVNVDTSKESMHILALHGGEGSNFKLFGVPFDHALSMKDAVVELVSEATRKMASILRIGRYFTDG